jgi:hypothetical protein
VRDRRQLAGEVAEQATGVRCTGQPDDVVHVKAEGDAINYGLRRGSAHIFNSRIINFGRL